MIELKSNPDNMHKYADDMVRAIEGMGPHNQIETEKAGLIVNAAHDIKNLRDYAYTLERTTNETSAEIQKWKDKAAEYQGMAEARESNYNLVCEQRDAAAAALLAIIRPELESMVNRLMDERLEDMQGDIEDMKERVDDIPNEDDINDAVREFMRYEAKFKVTLE